MPRQPRGRLAFLLIVVTCWAVGLIGLAGGRVLSFRLFAMASAGLVIHWLIGVLRRRAEEARDVLAQGPHVEPRTCVIVRRYGESDRAGANPFVWLNDDRYIPNHR